MGNDYVQYPGTVKGLAAELKVICDDYYTRKITNDRLREIITWYANSQQDKLFTGKEINPTVAKIIGKQRVRLICDLLKAENGGI